eukprot:scaffold14437_cov124-Isochrysis_galbana.AAC.2
MHPPAHYVNRRSCTRPPPPPSTLSRGPSSPPPPTPQSCSSRPSLAPAWRQKRKRGSPKEPVPR